LNKFTPKLAFSAPSIKCLSWIMNDTLWPSRDQNFYSSKLFMNQRKMSKFFCGSIARFHSFSFYINWIIVNCQSVLNLPWRFNLFSPFFWSLTLKRRCRLWIREENYRTIFENNGWTQSMFLTLSFKHSSEFDRKDLGYDSAGYRLHFCWNRFLIMFFWKFYG